MNWQDDPTLLKEGHVDQKPCSGAVIRAVMTLSHIGERQVLQNHEARYYYVPSEKVGEGDETAVFELGVE